MSKSKIVLNGEGIRSLLRSPEIQAICTKHADAALSKLGDGYEVTSMTGKNRCNAEVAAVSSKAKRDNSDNNTIMKAVQSS